MGIASKTRRVAKIHGVRLIEIGRLPNSFKLSVNLKKELEIKGYLPLASQLLENPRANKARALVNSKICE